MKMRKTFLNGNFILVLLFFLNTVGFAQKALIDSTTYGKWPKLENGFLSNDGKYSAFIVENFHQGLYLLDIRSNKSDWKFRISGPSRKSIPTFTKNGKFCLFTTSDSLVVVSLGRNHVIYVPNVNSYKVNFGGNEPIVAYKTNLGDELVLLNIKTGNKQTYDSVLDYLPAKNNLMLLKRRLSWSPEGALSLDLIDVAAMNLENIWRGHNDPGNFVFDEQGKQMFFLDDTIMNNVRKKRLWYSFFSNKSTLLEGGDLHIDSDTLLLHGIEKFSSDGKMLLYNVRTRTLNKDLIENIPVNVWSYKDPKLQSQQLNELEPKTYKALYNIETREHILLEQGHDRARPITNTYENFLIDRSRDDAGAGEGNWNPAARRSVFIFSTKEGTMKLVRDSTLLQYNISPSGKFLLYFDPEQSNFFSYSIESGLVRNITSNIKVKWFNSDKPDIPYGIYNHHTAGWIANDEAILLYDQFDIWLVDPLGFDMPVNLTKEVGRLNNIVFRVAIDEHKTKLRMNDDVILTAFNKKNKENGFYKMTISKEGRIEKLTMGPYIYDVTSNPYVPDGSNWSVRKSANAEMYLVRRMSATEFPNFFYTSDFRNLKRISNLQPEKQYNWLTSELHTYRNLNGDTLQGILYKPENFQQSKKYPIIFNYYENKSDGLNAYLYPGFLCNGCNLNIPWYVSNGYLVFTPDIRFKEGEIGESVLQSVLAAVKHVSEFGYVDTTKMGIQGCSLAGYETNFLITHTDVFAAACSSSGISNFTSGYGSLAGDGSVLQDMYESTFWRMGATLWQQTDRYIRNSPIFYVDRVNTPFLMFHTSVDGVCPFAQSIELFTALRRLGKKAWLLEYRDGDHGVWGKSEIDFSVRLSQFFDFYLKGKKPPIWMTKGVPAKKKGTFNDLDLDTSNVIP